MAGFLNHQRGMGKELLHSPTWTLEDRHFLVNVWYILPYTRLSLSNLNLMDSFVYPKDLGPSNGKGE